MSPAAHGRRVAPVVALAFAVLTLAPTGAPQAPPLPDPESVLCQQLGTNLRGGCPLWTARHNGPLSSDDQATSLALTPDGARAFVTGVSWNGAATGYDVATLAYNAANGQVLWSVRYDGPGHGDDIVLSSAVSADGQRLYVAGTQFTGAATGGDLAVLAYDAANGNRLWVAAYDGPGHSFDLARALQVSPDGAFVYVTGESPGTADTQTDYATLSLSSADGSVVWEQRMNGPASRGDFVRGLRLSPDGRTVFVAGQSFTSVEAGFDYATLAYDAITGAQLWESRYNGPQSTVERAFGLGLHPNGTQVFVTGRSRGLAGDYDYATVAYFATNGTQQWVHRFAGALGQEDTALAVAASPRGDSVFVTGYTTVGENNIDVQTFGLNADDGAELWDQRFNGPANRIDSPSAMTASPDGRRVFVTGNSAGIGTADDAVTVAYDAADGDREWVLRYNGPGNGDDGGRSIAVSPDSARVFLTGESWGGPGTSFDYATHAVRAVGPVPLPAVLP